MNGGTVAAPCGRDRADQQERDRARNGPDATDDSSGPGAPTTAGAVRAGSEVHAAPCRRLVVLRHAKSAWPDVPDEERPLADRGLRDAPAAGRWLREAGIRPDAVVCSPTLRTRQTWELVSGELGAPPERLVFDERVYGAGGARLLEVVRQLPDEWRCVLLVGHQPGVQELVLALAGDVGGKVARKFPTAGIAVLALDGPWARAVEGAARLSAFVAPRGQAGPG
ncbi:SixA phosphatase family protein [Kitasatospora sp. NPDC052896]|uniref:SixA phosphatase family protein n=1 Tax=Kitasatospora sp. NPDC052896 TaxID=3364061 RepID=UPI0037CB982C